MKLYKLGCRLRRGALLFNDSAFKAHSGEGAGECQLSAGSSGLSQAGDKSDLLNVVILRYHPVVISCFPLLACFI